MRILIINPFGIGDVIFTLPLIRDLKRYFPESHIGYLCNRRTHPLLNAQPDINSLYVYEKDEWRSKYKVSRLKTVLEFRKFLGNIKKMNFDVVFDLSLAQEFGFICWLLGIKKRLGYNYKNRGVFLNKRIQISGYSDRHITEYYSNLITLLGLKPGFKFAELHLPETILNWAEGEISKLKDRTGFIISCIPGGGASWGKSSYKKRWPEKKYKELLDLIKKETNAGILLLGDKKDKYALGDFPEDDAVLNYMGKTTLLEFAALIASTDLVITNDGGPLHIAVALSVPTLSIFGPVSEKIYGPYPVDAKHRVISLKLNCRPCYKNFKMPECSNYACLNGLSVDNVFNEFKRHLASVRI